MRDEDMNNYSDPNLSSRFDHHQADSVQTSSREGSPMMMSPWNQPSPSWSDQNNEDDFEEDLDTVIQPNRLIGSLLREEGHIYSLAASGDLLFTGSASKNIRVWKNLREFSGFRSNSGLVKAIIISGEKIFTGHQDGKIRIWKSKSPNTPNVYKRAGTLPTLTDVFKSSVNPSNYVQVRRRRMALWIKHTDAVSSLSMSEDQTFLYSASWDRTMKVWRVEDSKCLDSVKAHDDAVNAVVSAAGGLVFTGAADGTVKAWKRELHGKILQHVLVQKLLEQESAVTSLAVDQSGSVVYCGSSDGLVNFWERETKEQYFAHGGVLRGHRLAVLCLAAAGERVVLSGSADRTVCVWRREGLGHVCLSVLTGHSGPVKCLAVERDGDSVHPDRRWVVYSGSLDKSVKVWSVSEFAPDFNRTAVTQRYSDQTSLGKNSR